MNATIIKMLLKEYQDIVYSNLEDAESLDAADAWKAKLDNIDDAILYMTRLEEKA